MSSGEAVPRPVVSGGTTEHLRRANLSSALTLLHRDGPTSRADLTKALGLSRSTTGLVVADLAELGLVSEAPASSQARAGRPSGIVRPADDVVVVAVNPEVDAVHVGLVGFSGRVVKHARIETAGATDLAGVVALARATIVGMTSGTTPRYRVMGLGLAIPGQVRLADGQVRQATHLGWNEEPIAAMFETATGYPARAANAALAAMRAESEFGAGRGIRDLVYLIGGASGIGGGAVIDGRVLTGTSGYAGEFGHTLVSPDGHPCHCGARGCLEAEIDQETLLDAVGLASADASLLGDRLRASRDPDIRALVEEKSRLLGYAVRNAVNLFNPDAVVLSGFLAALHQASERDLIADAIASSRDDVTIVDARLGAEQLMIGSAELVFRELLADPAGFLADAAA